MLLFEDAHWADPTSLEVLDLLVDRVRAIPLLIVLTHRPEFSNPWADHGHVSALDLSKLTYRQCRAMVSNLTNNKPLPDDLLEQILIKTDGVPLFVEELTRSILESGELKEEGDRYAYTGTSHHVTIPATLRDSLMARLDRYAPVKEIAQMGAAIGREFSYELIAAVAPLQHTQLDEALSQLTDSGLAFRSGTPPEAIYTFKHALVQDAAYDSLLKSKRQELHGKIAKVLEERYPETKDSEPEVLAHHLSAAGQTEAAIPLRQRAGELAAMRSAHFEALAHYRGAIGEIEKLDPSIERDRIEWPAQLSLGFASMPVEGWASPRARHAFESAYRLAGQLGDTPMLVFRA